MDSLTYTSMRLSTPHGFTGYFYNLKATDNSCLLQTILKNRKEKY